MRKMKNANKVCFIMCVNEERMAQEAIRYISNLEIPEGFEIDLLTILDAVSMCAGYNEGMYASDAKYKVYLHQDVFLVNRRLIVDILNIFKDRTVGMIGVYGCEAMPEHGVMWYADRVGALYAAKHLDAKEVVEGTFLGGYREVEALDGLLLVTQYDIPWREDVFKKWDFYDVSQSMEFRKRGWKVVVANQQKPWCIHDEGVPDLLQHYYGTEHPCFLEYAKAERRPFYTMGKEYEKRNPNQAYLCYENALFHRELPESELREEMDRLKMQKNFSIKKTAFIIVSYNSKCMMQACIESIRDNHSREMYELVVVDNASTDGIREWLAEQNDIKLVQNTENVGFPAGCNQGIRLADADSDIFLLNNDTLVPEDALFWLRMGLYEDEKVGATGCLSNSAVNYQGVAEMDIQPEDYQDYARSCQQRMDYPYEWKSWLVGFALLLKREAVDHIGLLDEGFFPGNYEDNDYGMRLAKAGYLQGLCHNSFIYHYGGSSFGKNWESYTKILKKNETYFSEKWGISPSRYHYRKHELIQKITASPKENFTLLEVGCGCGATLSRLGYLYPNAKVCGVEKNQVAAEIAATVAKVLCMDIEQTDLISVLDDKLFDYILMGGVLECLENPREALESIGGVLKPQGKLILSCYNRQHISVLTVGKRAEQIDYGPLDQKHIQQFSGEELISLVQKSGYEVVDLSYERKPAQGYETLLLKREKEKPDALEAQFYEIWKYVLVLQKKLDVGE